MYVFIYLLFKYLLNCYWEKWAKNENENEPFFASCSDSQFWADKERIKPRSHRTRSVTSRWRGTGGLRES